MVRSLPKIYKTEGDNALVAHVTGVITCENYCKWYDLYYIDVDGSVSVLSDLYDEFFDEVEYLDNAFEPKSLVAFALKHKLYIGLESYKAICYMYAEHFDIRNESIPDDHLPTMQDLSHVLIEDYGNWSNCFPCNIILDDGFKFAEDYAGNWNPVAAPQESILSYGPFIVSRVNDYMYKVESDGRVYMIDDLSKIGDAMYAFVEDAYEDTIVGENKRQFKLPLQLIVDSDVSYDLDYNKMIDNPDLLKYYVPNYIDTYKEFGQFTDGMVISIPLAVCRGQADLRNRRKIQRDAYDKAIEEFKKLEDRRYLMVNNTTNDIISRTTCNMSDIIGRIIGIGYDRIYVIITNDELLNNFVEAYDLYSISAGMRFIGKRVYSDTDLTFTDFEELRIICFDIITRKAGNNMYYCDVRNR